MPSLSFWEKTSFFSNIDVVVVGSGIVGLNAAIALKSKAPSLHVLVLDQGYLPTGASTKNAGFACFGSMSELLDDLKKRSEDEVFALVEHRWKGLLKLRALLGDQNIGFQQRGSYELFSEKDEDSFESCAANMQAFNHRLVEITGEKSIFTISDEKIKVFNFGKTQHLLFNQAEGQLDTGKMMVALLRLARSLDIEIINGLGIEKIEEDGRFAKLQTTDGWSFQARKVLVATNGFSRKLFPHLDVAPARNQVLITQPIADLPFEGCFNYDRGYYYFRNVPCPHNPGQQRILFGGGRHLSPETEQTSAFGETNIIKENLESLLNEVIFPKRKLQIEQWWSGILGLGGQKAPIIEMVSPSVGVAVRLGGMGVAIGSLTGEQAAAMIMEDF